MTDHIFKLMSLHNLNIDSLLCFRVWLSRNNARFCAHLSPRLDTYVRSLNSNDVGGNITASNTSVIGNRVKNAILIRKQLRPRKPVELFRFEFQMCVTEKELKSA